MTELSEVRQKVNQARKLLAEGNPARARALLKGVEHPKAQALLAQIDEQLGQQGAKKNSFPLIPLLAFLLLLIVIAIVSIFLMSKANTASAEPTLVLPTPTATPDCTDETVQLWWAEQNLMLDTFVADASAASRTMPGERLTERLDSLRQIHNDFSPLPTCASPAMQTAISDLLQAMDDVIAVLDRWSNGELDGTQFSNEFYAVEQGLREARTAVHELVN